MMARKLAVESAHQNARDYSAWSQVEIGQHGRTPPSKRSAAGVTYVERATAVVALTELRAIGFFRDRTLVYCTPHDAVNTRPGLPGTASPGFASPCALCAGSALTLTEIR